MDRISKEYRQNNTQSLILNQEKVQLHGGMTQIPMFLTVEPDLDFELFRRVIDIEIERNDALRVFITKNKRKHTLTQHFVGPYHYNEILGEIEQLDFSKDTKENQERYLKKLANRPLRYEKFQLFRVAFIRTFENKTGVFISLSHMVFDAYGVFVTVSDILEVYRSMKEEKPLPKPLASFEELLAKHEKTQTAEKDEESCRFFYDFYDNLGKVNGYSGIIDPRLPHKAHDGNTLKNMLNLFFKDKSAIYSESLPKEKTDRWMDFCRENKISYASFFIFGLSAYWAKINNSNDIVFMNNLACRATVSDKRCAGNAMTITVPRYVLRDEDNVLDSVSNIEKTQFLIYRYAGFDILKLGFEAHYKISGYNYYGSSMFSIIGTPYSVPDGWKIDYEIISQGQAIIPQYLYLLPDLRTGGFKLYNEYMKEYTNDIQS